MLDQMKCRKVLRIGGVVHAALYAINISRFLMNMHTADLFVQAAMPKPAVQQNVRMLCIDCRP